MSVPSGYFFTYPSIFVRAACAEKHISHLSEPKWCQKKSRWLIKQKVRTCFIFRILELNGNFTEELSVRDDRLSNTIYFDEMIFAELLVQSAARLLEVADRNVLLFFFFFF